LDKTLGIYDFAQ